jgi:hypothetical protein
MALDNRPTLPSMGNLLPAPGAGIRWAAGSQRRARGLDSASAYKPDVAAPDRLRGTQKANYLRCNGRRGNVSLSGSGFRESHR